MRLQALEHLVEAVRAVTHCEAVLVAGSAALLLNDPGLSAAGEPVELTRDADLLLSPTDDELAKLVHESLGEGSVFDRRFGYHIDLLRPEVMSTFAPGWQQRTLAMQGARALSATDIAALKLCVGREKDLQTVKRLLQKNLVTRQGIMQLLESMQLAERDLHVAIRRLPA